ncbi:MAG: GNAT family N-acetyltransferase [Clostridia bacterium]|nr:GNAT family N-acetyltransferase [Clostridia bacterium]
MLLFEPCTLELLKRLKPYFRNLPTLCSDLSMGTIWMWRQEQEAQICFRNDTIVLRQMMNGYPAFTYPAGPDADGMLDALSEQVREEDIALRFFALDEDTLQRLLRDPRFPQTMWGYEARWSDYLYHFEPYADMSGSELRKIRYRVNHFIRLYGEPDIRPLLPEHMPAALELLKAYTLEHPDMDKLEEMELRHSRDLLDVYHALDLPAAGLWVQGRLAAICIGEVIGQTLMIHVEKALMAYTDIYPVMLRGFIRYVRDLGYGPLRWFNWEDDSGDPGIRRAKELYHPLRQVHKYQAHVRAPGAKVVQYPVLQADNAVLTAFRETDMEAYYRMNTDRENNHWWGYDYEEDFTLPRYPDPETFYRSVQYDMAVGDSMNFAVREREDGPMIGEALLWNFTDAGSAEVGMRLLPEYHGRGISKAGNVLIRYAEEELGLHTRARCLNNPDNKSALYSAIASGFRERRRDDTWIYLDRD